MTSNLLQSKHTKISRIYICSNCQNWVKMGSGEMAPDKKVQEKAKRLMWKTKGLNIKDSCTPEVTECADKGSMA